MELRLNLAMGAILALVWSAGLARDPEPLLALEDERAGELAALEDAFARDRSDPILARRLSEAYLELDRPGLAVAALRSAPADVLKSPLLTHRLAQAYEASGRLMDALATAELARARCARSLGTTSAAPVTPVPEHGCDMGLEAVLRVHRRALEQMTAWGVADPRRDPRARLAYDLALRRARIAATGR
ncbi:MAG: hypothetical protein ACODAU_00865 [Myxococcota bacterium]